MRITRISWIAVLGRALCAFALSIAAAPVLAGSTGGAPGRTELRLATGWHFHLGDIAGAERPGFDDSGWQRVAVPHTWNRLGNYGETRRADADTTRGIGWYRLHLQAPRLAPGQRAYFQFDAASIIADVWLNGHKLGRHEGAFSRFRVDATGALRPGDNVLAVKVDNSAPTPGSPTADIVPISGDFFMYGGLYRPVSLIVVGGAHVELLDHGSPGVFGTVAALDGREARVSVRSEIRNDLAASSSLTIETRIADAGGRTVATDRRPLALTAGQATPSTAMLTIRDPHRWDGRRDPYLYRIIVEVRDQGRVLDRVEQPLGLRTIRIDADKGFFLNGRHLKLHGVTRHQDRQDKGWAISDADRAEDMRLIEELGANTIRLSHYNQAPAFYDLADRDGMILWAELGLVNLTAPKGMSETPPAMIASAKQQLVELIRQNYNHPSVALWSIGNEVTNWSSKGLTPKGSARPLMTKLDALAKAEDPTRPTTIAVCCEPLPGEPDAGQERTSGTADTAAYNLYLGWYSTGHVEDAARLGAVMRGLHREHPTLPIAVGEYGGGGAVTQHTDNAEGGKLESIYRPQPEEAETAIHERSWAALEPLDFLWGSYVWEMFDSTSDLREEGDSSDINTKGLVTFDRRTKKDAYYFYQAAWRKDVPIMRLAERHYVDRAYRVVDVQAFSNATSAELSLNGRPLGRADCRNYVCAWPGVRLAMGKNRLTATAIRDGRRVSDSIAWDYRGPPRALHVRTGSLTGTTLADGTRYGSDDYFSGGVGHTLNPYKRELYAATSGNTNPVRMVTGTTSPQLYASWRAGKAFSYALPLPDGGYRVTLHLFEPEGAAAGARLFSVRATGGFERAGIDPARLAGGALKATTITFDARAANGILRLDFSGQKGEAVVSAIDATPLGSATAGRPAGQSLHNHAGFSAAVPRWRRWGTDRSWFAAPIPTLALTEIS